MVLEDLMAAGTRARKFGSTLNVGSLNHFGDTSSVVECSL